MKRLFIVFSVVISSFFLFKEDVNASEATITYEDYSLVNSNSFNLVFESAKEKAEVDNYEYYFILQYPSSLNYYVIYFNTANSSKISYKQESSSSDYYYILDFRYLLIEKYNSLGEFDSIVSKASTSTIHNSSYYRIASLESSANKTYYYLYSNFDILFTYYYNDLIMEFPHITYTFNSQSNNEIFPSLYSVYSTYGDIEVPDIHKKEKETLASFYTICIEKIGYLSSQISSNYIYLSMITIFIFIFVIELIRRYLM